MLHRPQKTRAFANITARHAPQRRRCSIILQHKCMSVCGMVDARDRVVQVRVCTVSDGQWHVCTRSYTQLGHTIEFTSLKMYILSKIQESSSFLSKWFIMTTTYLLALQRMLYTIQVIFNKPILILHDVLHSSHRIQRLLLASLRHLYSVEPIRNPL